MMKAAAASLAMGVAVAQGGGDDEYYEKEFTKFVYKFKKTYGPHERFLRFVEFKRNFNLVASHNAKMHTAYTLAVNEFSDSPMEEFKLLHLGYKAPSADRNASAGLKHLGVHSYDGALLDESVDWRKKGKVTPVVSQGHCGSCWAFSTIASLESAWAIATGTLISLSEQQVANCVGAFQPNGCDGGSPFQGMSWAENQNVCTSASIPYTDGNSVQVGYPPHGTTAPCSLQGCQVGIPRGGVVGVKHVQPNDQHALMSALMRQPVSVCIDAGCPLFQHYHSGVAPNGCGNGEGPEAACKGGCRIDHAVAAVGYGYDQSSGRPYWIVKNSWGSATWGEGGYIRMERGQAGEGEFGILSGPSYPVVNGGVRPGPPSPSPYPPSPYPPAPSPYPPSPTPSPWSPPSPSPYPPSPYPPSPYQPGDGDGDGDGDGPYPPSPYPPSPYPPSSDGDGDSHGDGDGGEDITSAELHV